MRPVLFVRQLLQAVGGEPVDAEVVEDVGVGEVVSHMFLHGVGLDLGQAQENASSLTVSSNADSVMTTVLELLWCVCGEWGGGCCVCVCEMCVCVCVCLCWVWCVCVCTHWVCVRIGCVGCGVCVSDVE